jgi:hypothetical protein
MRDWEWGIGQGAMGAAGDGRSRRWAQPAMGHWLSIAVNPPTLYFLPHLFFNTFSRK